MKKQIARGEADRAGLSKEIAEAAKKRTELQQAMTAQAAELRAAAAGLRDARSEMQLLERIEHELDEELQDLVGSTVYSVTKKRKQTLTADYNNIFGVLFDEFPALFDKASYTLDAYKWAVSTVWARSFVFNIDGSQVPVIVPFADMFEHGNVASKFSLSGPS